MILLRARNNSELLQRLINTGLLLNILINFNSKYNESIINELLRFQFENNSMY